MIKYVKAKYLYFSLPLTYVFTCVFVTINYIIMKNTKKAIQTLAIGMASSIVLFLFIPLLISSLGFSNVFDGSFLFVYFYIMSTIIGIFIIRKQEKYINKVL